VAVVLLDQHQILASQEARQADEVTQMPLRLRELAAQVLVQDAQVAERAGVVLQPQENEVEANRLHAAWHEIPVAWLHASE